MKDTVESRGLARALTGDYKGVIFDFQYFVAEQVKKELGQNSNVQNRQQWIIDLEDGIDLLKKFNLMASYTFTLRT